MAMKFKFPPGGYFTPNDYDLIEFYLKPRVLGHDLAYDVVEETEVYGPNSSPWKIFDPNHLDCWFVNPTKNSEKVRYVFTNLCKIGKGGGGEEMRSRINTCKKAGSGTWVGETGKDTIMDSHNKVIGETKLLVFKINEIDPAAGDLQFGYYKMHEYSLAGNYANFDVFSTLVLCKITYDSSKKCSYVKKNPSSSSSVHKKQPAVLPKPKRVNTKSSNKQQFEKGGVSDHSVLPKPNLEGGVGAGSVCNNLEGGAGDHLVGGCVCDSLAPTVFDNFDSGAGSNFVGVQCTIASTEDIGLDCPCVDFGGSGESVCDYLVGVPNMNEFGDYLDLDVGFSFDDEWIREITNPIQEEPVQDSTITNLRKRKFESENSCMAKKLGQWKLLSEPLLWLQAGRVLVSHMEFLTQII